MIRDRNKFRCDTRKGKAMNRTPQTLKHLQTIPGVGKSIAQDLVDLGITSVSQLKRRNPERLYLRHCEQKGMAVDRCVLYVFRCAVYYASHKRRNPELLKWWNWRD